jgi:hypothetical protein
VLWFVIAVIHQRGSSQDFDRSLAQQGGPWNRMSIHIPKGKGPFPSWEVAAIIPAGGNSRCEGRMAGEEVEAWRQLLFSTLHLLTLRLRPRSFAGQDGRYPPIKIASRHGNQSVESCDISVEIAIHHQNGKQFVL